MRLSSGGQSIKTGSELLTWFSMNGAKIYKVIVVFEGVFVTEEVRREVLTSVCQGRISVRETLVQIKFEDLKGGVWRAYIDYFVDKEAK